MNLDSMNSMAFWGMTGIYALSAVLYVLGVVFDSAKLIRWAKYAAWAGVAVNTLQIAVQWVRAGHGPYMTRVEVASSTCWIIVTLFLAGLKWLPEMTAPGAFILPLVVLALGFVGTNATMATSQAPLSFATTWLVIHVIFTQLFVVCALAAAGLGYTGLVNWSGRGAVVRIPRGAEADELIYRFTLAGFLFLSIMILAGAIWANHAWGRYWGWDNIEVWSLICWLIYALELHLIRTLAWRGRRLAWLTLATLAVALFTMFGVVLVFPSIHSSYMVR